MTDINFIYTIGSGCLEADFDQLKGLLEEGTYTAPTFDVTALKIGGTTITSSAAELNYCDGVTSNIQTQLNNITTKTDFITVAQAVDLDTMESDIATNNAKVSNATHTGEVTGSTSLTIADNVVDEANLKLDTAPTNDYVLTADSTASGGMKWAEVPSGGAAATFERTYSMNLGTGSLIPIVIPDELDGKDIKEVRISVTGLPVGQNIKLDVRKNGTATTDSIFTSDAEIEMSTSETTTNGLYQSGCNTSGATVGTPATTIDSARDTLAADDVLNLYVTQAGSTISGANLIVTITVA